MKLSEYLDDQIQSANVVGNIGAPGSIVGTRLPDGSFIGKGKGNKKKFKKKKQNVVNGIMQARPLPKEKP